SHHRSDRTSRRERTFVVPASNCHVPRERGGRRRLFHPRSGHEPCVCCALGALGCAAMSQVLDQLFTILSERAYAEGDFTLASGRKSRYYFDSKQVIFDQQGARLFARWLLDRIGALAPRPTAVGGLEIGAIPIACTAAALAEFPLAAFVVRKQPKG